MEKRENFLRKSIENIKKAPLLAKIVLPFVLIYSSVTLISELRGVTNWSNVALGFLIFGVSLVLVVITPLIILVKKYPPIKNWFYNAQKNNKNAIILGLILAVILVFFALLIGGFLNRYLPLD